MTIATSPHACVHRFRHQRSRRLNHVEPVDVVGLPRHHGRNPAEQLAGARSST